MHSDGTRHVNDLLQMGGQPSTAFICISSAGEIKNVVHLGTDFSHCYGIDRLWAKNEWLSEPILLHICKQCGGNEALFEDLFYDAGGKVDLNWTKDDTSPTGWKAAPEMVKTKYAELNTSAETALLLFTKMKAWLNTDEYNKFLDQLKQNGLPFLDYLENGGLEEDLSALTQALGKGSPKDKLYIEIAW